MVKRALTLLTSILIALHLLMPFNIYADTITNSNVLGINTVLLSKSQNVDVTDSWYYVYQHTITLDADYIGTISLDVNITYINPSGSSSTYGTSSISNKTYFVNGNTITINQIVTSDNFGNQGPIVASSYLLKNSNIVKTSTITELQQIIDLLNDIYNSEDQVEGLLNNQLEQLQLVVSNTSLANEYLDNISKIRQWGFPMESFSFVSFCMKYDIIDYFKENNYYSYPIFNIKTNQEILNRYSYPDYEYTLIAWFNHNIYNVNKFLQNYSINQDYSLIEYKNLNSFFYNEYYYLVKMVIRTKQKSPSDFIIKSLNDTNKIIPIYYYLSTNEQSRINPYLTTDFAIKYGLTNKVLDNLNIIANGTTASHSTSQSSDSTNSLLQTESNTLFQQENNFKSDMQNSMQNVDTTFRLENMGTKFVSSAQWVRTQYENLTNNTPFASLITFSLITGLALILLGKVYK